ncbi:MAG: hypothetical protein A2Y38_12920 [Spirochaetes bacterium GWB1_59_5]|nr:MAG: hypothetical protein A2Y38_12920 [Spirochaetes bacterium GWB1_59_5]
MGAPMVIKWTDAGTPTLSRAASSLIGVLDYCLPQKGWTKVFSGTDKAVYRAGSGERKFFRVLNDGSFYYSGTTYQYCHAKITAYDSMTDVDTGTGQWGEQYFNLSAIGTAVPRPWMCVFNETTLLFVCLPTKTTGLTLATSNSNLLGLGDTLAALPGNSSRSFLAGVSLYNPPANYSSIVCPLAEGTGANILKIRCNRSLDSARTNIDCGLFNNGGRSGVDNGSLYPFGRSSAAVLDYPYNGELLYGRPMLNDALAQSMGDYIPGLFYPCQKGNTLDNWGAYTADVTSFIGVRVVSSTGANFDTTIISDIGAVLISLAGGHWT